MSNPRIIRALELIHDAKLAHEQESPAFFPCEVTRALGCAEDELLQYIAESKRAERLDGRRLA